MPLLCNTWPPTPVAPWVNFSVTMACTLLSFSTICLSKPLPTVKCLSFWDVHQVVRPTLVTFSTFTPVSWREPPRWATPKAVDPWLPFPSLRHKWVGNRKKNRQIISWFLSSFFHRPVMCPLISQPTSFLSLTDKFSWRPSCSTKVFAPLSTSVCLYPVSDLLPRLNPWNKYDFSTFSFKKGQN